MKYLIIGAGGFVGGHLIKKLLIDGHDIVAVDIKPLSDWFQVYNDSICIDNIDCRISEKVKKLPTADFVVNLACDHGGVGYLVNNDLRALLDVTININLLQFVIDNNISDYLFASSACVYNSQLQDDNARDIFLKEADAWPSLPDMKYGLEKLYSEELCLEVQKKYGIRMYLPRIHGCYGPYNHFDNIKEKAPNALLRKALICKDEFEIWGSGKQRRSFMYVDDAIEGICRLMKSSWHLPINLGSDITVTIDQVANIALDIVGKQVPFKYVDAAVGVQSRSSDNKLISNVLGWKPAIDIKTGLSCTRPWMENMLDIK